MKWPWKKVEVKIPSVTSSWPPFNQPPTACSKCGGEKFSGPVYIPMKWMGVYGPWYPAYMQYACTRCGAKFMTRTKDDDGT